MSGLETQPFEGIVSAQTSGNATSVIDSDNLSLGLGPIRLIGSMQGGSYDTLTGQVPPFLMELRLRQYDSSGNDHGRVWLFPGISGRCQFSINLASWKTYGNASSNRWLLEAYTPTGAGASSGSVSGTIIVGGQPAEEYWHYSASVNDESITDQNNFFEFGITVAPWPYNGAIKAQTRNNGSAGTVTTYGSTYVDSLSGGPDGLSSDLGSYAAGAGATGSGTFVPANKHAIITAKYSTAPTGGDSFVTIAN